MMLNLYTQVTFAQDYAAIQFGEARASGPQSTNASTNASKSVPDTSEKSSMSSGSTSTARMLLNSSAPLRRDMFIGRSTDARSAPSSEQALDDERVLATKYDDCDVNEMSHRAGVA